MSMDLNTEPTFLKPAWLSPLSSPVSSPEPRKRYIRRSRLRSIEAVVNLQGDLSRIQNKQLDGLNIDEQKLERRLSESVGVKKTLDSRDSIDSLTSNEGDTTSVTSEDSDISLEANDVPPGCKILKLPMSEDLLTSDEANLLAHLLAGKLSNEEKMAIPAKFLQSYCIQAMGDILHMVELATKIRRNLHLLNLPDSAKKTIQQKLEHVEAPYVFLKGDIDECLKGFLEGSYISTRQTIEPLASDKPDGKCRVSTTQTNLVEKLVYCWTYMIRNQEEWRKAMPSPAQLMPDAKMPDVMALSEEQKHSAQKKVDKLVKDVETMTKLWKGFAGFVKPVPVKKSTSLSTLGGATAQASTEKPQQPRLPGLFRSASNPALYPVSFTVERFQLPVVHDTSRLEDVDSDIDYSQWVLPDSKQNYETKSKTVYSSRSDAEKAIADSGKEARANPRLFGTDHPLADGVLTAFTVPVTTRPPCYFEYLPIASNALEKLATIGQTNVRKVCGPAMLLAGDKFGKNKKDSFSGKQNKDWKILRQKLQEDVCKLWELKIPSLQEVVYSVCKEAEEQKRRELLKAKRKERSTLRYQVIQLKGKVQSFRSPRSSPLPSPVLRRRIKSSPELPVDRGNEPLTMDLKNLSPMGGRTFAAVTPEEFMSRMQTDKKRKVPEIVVETGLLMPPVPDTPIRGLQAGQLSPIPSEHGSLTSEGSATPKGGGSSPEMPGDEVATPMVETSVDPFPLGSFGKKNADTGHSSSSQ